MSDSQPIASLGTDFLEHMAILDGLRQFASAGARTAFLATLRVDFDEPHVRAEAGQWLRAFNVPLEALDEYRAAYLAGREFESKELKQALEAAGLAIDAFRRRVASTPQPA